VNISKVVTPQRVATFFYSLKLYNQEQNAVSGSYKHHPLLPVYDIAGNFAGSRGANLGNNSNPYATLAREADNTNYRIRAFGNVYAEYDIIPDLKLKTSFGVDVTSDRGKYLGRANPEYIEGSFNNGSTSTSRYFYSWTWSNTLSYNKTFNKDHKFDAYIGIESIKEFGEYFQASRQGYAFETVPIISYLNLGDATKSGNEGFAFRDYTLYSQFGKLNYAYKDKYLFQAILRNDQSSRFLLASRNAVFPAFSLGWRMSEEGFIKNELPFIDDLKLRFGWGKTGNQKIGDYNAYTTYRADIFHAGYPIDGSSSSPRIGYDTQASGNPNAKWETTTSTNFGIDASLFKSKLAIDLDIWTRKTTDMLFKVPTTFTAGDADNPAFNVGAMTNTGIDFGINYRNSTVNGIRYSVGANVGTYKNIVDKLDESPTTKYIGDGSRVGAVSVTQAGLPISTYFGYKVLGIFQTAEEAKAWAPYGTYNAVGKFKMADINGDGKIDDSDRTTIGSPHPDFNYGLTASIGYKAFDLSVFCTGVQGNSVFNYTRVFSDFNTFQGNRSKRALYEAWQTTNTSGKTPIMDANDQISSRPSSYFVEDGSYFRIKNVQLTYSMPSKLSSVIGIANCQIYLQGQNLATFTKYTGLNPEIQTGRDATLGFDGGYMPVSKTILLGLNIGF
jgi:TonB-dependent starch-binding outer membrane protein SusC